MFPRGSRIGPGVSELRTWSAGVCDVFFKGRKSETNPNNFLPVVPGQRFISYSVRSFPTHSLRHYFQDPGTPVMSLDPTVVSLRGMVWCLLLQENYDFLLVDSVALLLP